MNQNCKFQRGLRALIATGTLTMLATLGSGCGDDNDGPMLSPAQQSGVGTACQDSAHCAQQPVPLTCLAFKGGYCGLEGCSRHEDCPPGSACVAHEDGKNYCFLICTDKPQCNPTRPLDATSNCVSSVNLVGGGNYKACVPPS